MKYLLLVGLLGACTCGGSGYKEYSVGEFVTNGYCSGPVHMDLGGSVIISPVKCGELTKDRITIRKSELKSSSSNEGKLIK